MRRRASVILVLSLVSAVALTPLQAGAVGEFPAYCGNKKLVLTEGQSLVEKTVYLHGNVPAGDVDSRVDVNRLYMDSTAPTSAVSSVKVNAAAAANPASNKNSLLSAWTLFLTEPERIICATTTFHAHEDAGFSTQLFIDQPRGLESTVAASGSAAPSGTDAIRAFTGSFGSKLDKLATSEVTLQLTATTAAPVFYDSTQHPGSLTYLTLVGP